MKMTKNVLCAMLAVCMILGLLLANGSILTVKAAEETLVNLDFENGSMDGWKDNTTTPYSGISGTAKEHTTRNIVDAGGTNPMSSKALEVKNFSGVNYQQQYDLGASVDNAVLEYKFSLYQWSEGHMGLYLPTLLYEGVADEALNVGAAPLGLYVMCGTTKMPVIYYNYGRGIERGKVEIASLDYNTVYTLKIKYDLSTKSVAVYLDGNVLELKTEGLEPGADSSIINDQAKLDRVSFGGYTARLTWAYIDDIKVTTTASSSSDNGGATQPTQATQAPTQATQGGNATQATQTPGASNPATADEFNPVTAIVIMLVATAAAFVLLKSKKSHA